MWDDLIWKIMWKVSVNSFILQFALPDLWIMVKKGFQLCLHILSLFIAQWSPISWVYPNSHSSTYVFKDLDKKNCLGASSPFLFLIAGLNLAILKCFHVCFLLVPLWILLVIQIFLMTEKIMIAIPFLKKLYFPIWSSSYFSVKLFLICLTVVV